MTGLRRDDREMDAILRSWLADDAGPSPDRSGQVRRIMGHVDQVRQRRRLWPRIPFGQRAAAGAADGAEAPVVPTHGHTSALVPSRALSVAVVAVLLSVSLLWVASRPAEQQLVPAGWPVDPADRALFKGFVALWGGEDADLATLQGVYAEDAQLRLLWLDEEEVVSGHVAIRERIGELEPTRTEWDLFRLEDHFSGARRYLLTPAASGSTPLAASACVLWIEADRVRLHDCILPASFEDMESLRLDMPDASARAEREALADSLTVALAAHEPLENLIAPDVAHHVLSANQTYTLEGITEYRSVMSLGGTTTLINVDVPAPDGEIRWANFSQVSSGSLCLFWARDGLITRHDCIVPSTTTVPASLTEIEAPPGS